MNKETSKNIALAEEVLQELAWLGKDRTAGGRRAAPPGGGEQKRLEKALKPFNLLQLALRLKADRAFGHARQILHFMRNSQVVEPELKRVHEESQREPEGNMPGASGDAGEKPDDRREADAWEKALKIAGDPRRMLRLAQHHAFCTYKDSGLPARTRLDAAFQILREADDLPTTQDQETLGLAGAINRRLWEVEGLKRHLEHSLHFYRRGYELGVEKDYGYTAINAAFVLDLLAEYELKQARDSGLKAAEAEAVLRSVGPLRAEADRIRAEIVDKLAHLPEQEGQDWLLSRWWFLVTIAEANFGLGFRDEANFERAARWLNLAAALPDVHDWEFETTARQLAALGRLRSDASLTPEGLWESEPFKRVLGPFLKEKAAGLRASLAGKVGLVLSGGGFRASLFHVGVLAKLAEIDMLRNVEVLSCVSAGSIIGALYYLELRQMLQRMPDANVSREDYVELVMRVERNFLAAVQRNIRTRLGAEFRTNFKTTVFPDYTRTERVAELLDEMLYNPAVGLGRGRRLTMDELDILPRGEDEATFNPSGSNWRRAAKVPTLVLNATTLNTGHNWQFTTDWMGEPATGIDPEIDRNPRLRPVRYEHAPDAYKGFPLSRAVAASTCTLGLMEPVTLGGLYPGMTVRLVDGVFSGAQCADAALERDCNVLLVSDASGQMSTENDPGQGIFRTTMRSSNILFNHFRSRNREGLEARRRASLLRGLMFLHLRKGLDAEALYPDGEGAPVAPDDARPQTPSELTRYGVLKEVQRRLAEIRTDIDSFSDAEAYALMMSGYLMTAHEFPNCVAGYPATPPTRPPWRFLAIEEPMKTAGNKQLAELLDAASRQVFKFVELSPVLRGLLALASGVILVVLPLLLAAYFVYTGWAGAARLARWSDSPALAALLAALLLFAAYLGALVLTKRKTLSQVVVGLLMCTVGWVFSRLTLHVLDPWYLGRGRIGSLHKGGKRRARAMLFEPGPEPQNDARPTRPFEYLSQKVDTTGSVKTIGRMVDHARAVEAVARLFEHSGYQTTRYPRDQNTNPLQLKLDLHARKGERQVFAIVRTPGDSDNTGRRALSDLDAAAYMLSDAGDGVPQVRGLLVFVDAARRSLPEELSPLLAGPSAEKAVASYTEAEVEGFAKAGTGDDVLEEGARGLEKLMSSGRAGAAVPTARGEV